MKNFFTLLLALFLLSFHSKAQEQEIQQLLLNVEKLAQLKNMLHDLKKGYEIVYGGYHTIKTISQGSFNLHQQFLNGLLQISPAVKQYKRVGDVIKAQATLVKEYKKAYSQFKKSNLFRPAEIDNMGRVYANLFTQSLRNLDALSMILTAHKLRMSDSERLTAIDAIWQEAAAGLQFLRHFNSNTRLLALQREREATDIKLSKSLYGVIN